MGVWLLFELVGLLELGQCAIVPHATTRSMGALEVRVRIDRGSQVSRLSIEGLGLASEDVPFVLTDHAGRARRELPTGRYRVRITHGPLYAIEEREIRIEADQTARLDVALRREVDAEGFVACDLHVHTTTSSDSEVTYADRVRSLLAEGVSFVVPTDHNHITDLGPAARHTGLSTVPGVEVTTWGPQLGHFNAFPLEPDPNEPRGGAPSYQGWTPHRLFDALHERGALVQVNHPRLEGGIGYFDHAEPDPNDLGFDLLEVWNGFQMADPDALDAGFEEWLRLIEGGARVVAVGNSDSHDMDRQWAGYPRTWVRASSEPDAILKELRGGRAVVSTGPLLEVSVSGRGPGEWIPRGRHQVRVTLGAPRWMELDRVEVWVGTRRVATADAQRTVRVSVDVDAPLVVAVRGAEPMRALIDGRSVEPRAFSNPVWVR